MMIKTSTFNSKLMKKIAFILIVFMLQASTFAEVQEIVITGTVTSSRQRVNHEGLTAFQAARHLAGTIVQLDDGGFDTLFQHTAPLSQRSRIILESPRTGERRNRLGLSAVEICRLPVDDPYAGQNEPDADNFNQSDGFSQDQGR